MGMWLAKPLPCMTHEPMIAVMIKRVYNMENSNESREDIFDDFNPWSETESLADHWDPVEAEDIISRLIAAEVPDDRKTDLLRLEQAERVWRRKIGAAVSESERREIRKDKSVLLFWSLALRDNPGLKCARCSRGPMRKRRQWVLADKNKINLRTGERRHTDLRQRRFRTEEGQRRRIEDDLRVICRSCWDSKFLDEEGRQRRLEGLERGRRVRWERLRKEASAKANGTDMIKTRGSLQIEIELDGIELREDRMRFGIAQADFARRADISRPLLQRVERKRINLITAALALSIFDVFLEEEPRTNTQQKILEKVQEERAKILPFLEYDGVVHTITHETIVRMLWEKDDVGTKNRGGKDT